MVACAAVSVQLCYPDWMQPQSAGSTVDQLKQQLLLAVENANIPEATAVIAKLEKSGVSKEILEVTRVGAVVNDIRKRLVETAPELSKRCRALIKSWQKLVEPRPASSCGTSSNGGTPSLISPSVRRLTPGTPARGVRVTSTGLSVASRSNTSSPSVVTPSGSYSSPHPRAESSPNGSLASTFKSSSVGADLIKKAVEDSIALTPEDAMRNGKRKVEQRRSIENGLTNGLPIAPVKRSKYGSTASPASYLSVVAARRANVQSTSELVAQLSENLPQYMTFDLSEHEQKVKREQELATQAQNDALIHQHSGPQLQHASSTPAISLNDVPKKKEKRGRPKKIAVELSTVAEKQNTMITSLESISSVSAEAGSPCETLTVPPFRNGMYDWNALLPSLETLRNRKHERVKPSSNARKSTLYNVRGREVLALPLIDIGLPDFFEYNYPNQSQFYAEENLDFRTSRLT